MAADPSINGKQLNHDRPGVRDGDKSAGFGAHRTQAQMERTRQKYGTFDMTREPDKQRCLRLVDARIDGRTRRAKRAKELTKLFEDRLAETTEGSVLDEVRRQLVRRLVHSIVILEAMEEEAVAGRKIDTFLYQRMTNISARFLRALNLPELDRTSAAMVPSGSSMDKLMDDLVPRQRGEPEADPEAKAQRNSNTAITNIKSPDKRRRTT